MRAGGDVTRVFHHVGQKLAEQRGVHGVDFLVALTNGLRLFGRAGRIDVKNVLQLDQGEFRKMLEAAGEIAGNASLLNGDDALGGVLAEVADPLEISSDPQRTDNLA